MRHTQRRKTVELIERYRLRVTGIAKLSRFSMHAARVSDFIADRPLSAGFENEIIRIVAAAAAVLDFYNSIPVDIAANPEWTWRAAEELSREPVLTVEYLNA